MTRASIAEELLTLRGILFEAARSGSEGQERWLRRHLRESEQRCPSSEALQVYAELEGVHPRALESRRRRQRDARERKKDKELARQRPGDNAPSSVDNHRPPISEDGRDGAIR